MATSGKKFNIASYLPLRAREMPDQRAVVVTESRDRQGRPRYAHLTFSELEAESNRYANGLVSAGLRRDMRVVVMVRLGLEYAALVFALFKIGAVPVMIDPGMGVRSVLRCIQQTEPGAFIGVPAAHVVRLLHPRAFRTVKFLVTVGRRWFWGGHTLRTLCDRSSEDFAPVDTKADDVAAILFTSGSTGLAKGVVYEHGMFDAQMRAIQSHYGIEPGEIDLPAFPLFALFSTAMGMTSVIPDIDPSHPAEADPRRIIQAVKDHKVTSSFGSPALWSVVAQHCLLRGTKLPSLRRILIAGAPVRPQLIDQLRQVLSPEAEVHTPYGATECLPVASISGSEVLGDCREKSRQGAGTCVGRPLPGMEVRIIRIRDEPIGEWREDLVLPPGRTGEIVACGDVMTKRYWGLDGATALAKITQGSRTWHRMGDLGYFDDQDRLWFCGRKAHRVETESGTLYSVCCEAIYNRQSDVGRSALVGVGPSGKQKPIMIIEPADSMPRESTEREALRDRLRQGGRRSELTHTIEHILFHPSFPVDVRHNAKINREALAEWAKRQLQ